MRTRAAVRLEARSFPSLLAAFAEARLTQGMSPQATRAATRRLPRFFAYLKTRRISDAQAVKEEHVVGFLHRYRHLSVGTQANWTTLIGSFFAFLEKKRVVIVSPARTMPRPVVDRLPADVLSEAEARRLMAAPPSKTRTGQRDRAILEIFYGAGLRLNECLRLDLIDVDLSQGRLVVRSGKGRKDRVVPLSGRAALAFEVYLREGRSRLARNAREPALFLSKQARRLSPARLAAMMQEHARTAKIKKPVHPHALRHTCATHLLKGGADVRHVQALLGHTRLESTALYTRVFPQDLMRVIERCHPRERSRSLRFTDYRRPG